MVEEACGIWYLAFGMDEGGWTKVTGKKASQAKSARKREVKAVMGVHVPTGGRAPEAPLSKSAARRLRRKQRKTKKEEAAEVVEATPDPLEGLLYLVKPHEVEGLHPIAKQALEDAARALGHAL